MDSKDSKGNSPVEGLIQRVPEAFLVQQINLLHIIWLILNSLLKVFRIELLDDLSH